VKISIVWLLEKRDLYFFHEGSRYEYEAPLSEFPISRSQSQGRREAMAMVTKHHDDLPIFVLFLLPYSPSPAPCSVHTTHGPRLAGYRRAYTTSPTVRNPSLSFVLPPLALVTRTQRGQQRENGRSHYNSSTSTPKAPLEPSR